ncbi:hypothetical protein QN326_07450 [Candidatus Phytoplasma asteris]|uniref:Uncharacterized protein n=1 Tax=Candidatus Phytoplasma asteris TaxID=85620 RepID=A0ABZ3CEX6_9MOLU
MKKSLDTFSCNKIFLLLKKRGNYQLDFSLKAQFQNKKLS